MHCNHELVLHTKNCIDVVVWDSLLQDGACNEEKYLEDMEKQLHEGLEVMMP